MICFCLEIATLGLQKLLLRDNCTSCFHPVVSEISKPEITKCSMPHIIENNNNKIPSNSQKPIKLLWTPWGRPWWWTDTVICFSEICRIEYLEYNQFSHSYTPSCFLLFCIGMEYVEALQDPTKKALSWKNQVWFMWLTVISVYTQVIDNCLGVGMTSRNVPTIYHADSLYTWHTCLLFIHNTLMLHTISY